MSPEQFVKKWKASTLKESSSSHEHFLDLCELLGIAPPGQADPTGAWFCFEKGAKKAGGGDGWADVWRRGCFGWEYKGKGKDLPAAFKQLQIYAPALDYPPLLIVCDIARIVIHTAFTGTVHEVHVLTLDDLLEGAKRQWLKWAFTDPERLRPGRTTAHLTEAAAGRFGELAQHLRARGHDPAQVAHFCQRILFCLFAEDIDLLPSKMFTRILESGRKQPARLPGMLMDLFGAMASGGHFGADCIDWFNGGLFDSSAVLPLAAEDIQALLELAYLDWSAIDPSIFGTLFERGLDPDKRAQLGAHYTDPGSILRLVNPVVLEPLRAEWAEHKASIVALMAKASAAKSPSARTKARNEAQGVLQGFLERLARFRVLDPACGSGNFLLLSLTGLKDLEHQVLLEAEALGLPRGFPLVGPENLLGLEVNPYAAELARVTLWIGEIQWMLSHGFSLSKNPILKALNTIAQRDAILNPDGSEPDWPEVDAIVGNPPFLGGSKKRGALGDVYFKALDRVYAGRVPAGADLVTYWFEKARAQITAGKAQRAGLVATNSIRGGANRKVLERIVNSGRIFAAWSDEPWINEGAAVRVSLVCFGNSDAPAELNGQPVAAIHADLTGQGFNSDAGSDLTGARPLAENQAVSFQGSQKIGAFDIPGELARSWLKLPNPHGKPNSDVLKPSWNGIDLTRRPRDGWIIDFGTKLSEAEAALYEAPFSYVTQYVKPERDKNNREAYRRYWWRHGEPRVAMRATLHGLPRYIATPHVAKHRVFMWLHSAILADKMLIVIARSDDTTFGVLHSRFHELWALRLCTWLGVGNDPRYTPTTTFETFPFPEAVLRPHPSPLPEGEGVNADDPDARFPAIAEAARKLNQLREHWLNPPEWVERVPEITPLPAGEGRGVRAYPDRLIPKPGHEKDLKQRTLTNLYNARPAWLIHAHQALDAAVAAAYGWEDYTPEMPDAEILRRLLALNLSSVTN